MHKSPVHILLVGWDGAEPELVEPWVQRGKLPVLASLAARGALGRVRSTMPALTPPAWTSLVTGVDPGRHGIYSFTRPGPNYREQVVTTGDRCAPSVWQLLSATGRRVGVFNFSLSYPPEPVKGFFFSGFDSPVFGPAIAYPAEAYALATSGLRGYVHEGVDRLRDEAAEHEYTRQMLQQRDMLFRLTRRWPVEVLAVNYNAADRLHHTGWPQGWTAQQLAASSGSAIEGSYRALDRVLGDLLAEYADESTQVLLVSDHGGGPLLGQVNLSLALEAAGLLVRRPRQRPSPLVATLKAVRRRIPQSVKGHVQRLAGARLRHAVGARLRGTGGADVDWSRTVAFPWGSRGFIQVNQRGREAQGCVAPEDRDRVLTDVEACLRELRDPVTGRPVIGLLERGETLYREPRAGHAPDLLAEGTDEEYAVKPWGDGESPRKEIVRHFGCFHDCPRGVTANHRRWGLLATCGPAVRPGTPVPELDLQDVAPALLYLAGEPIPAGLDGQLNRTLWDTGAKPVLGAAAPTRAGATPAAPYTAEEQAAVEARLAELGYM